MSQSEVMRIRRQIELECESIRLAMTGYAMVASHEVINRKYEQIGRCQDQLEALVGQEQATLIMAETYINVLG